MIASAPVYEVSCHSCNVTFPPETKRCIHCGSKLGGGTTLRAHPAELLGEPPPPVEVPEEAAPRRSLARIGMTGVWLVLAILFSIQRACDSG